VAKNNPFDEGNGIPGRGPARVGPRPTAGGLPQDLPPGVQTANEPFVKGAYGDTGEQQYANSNLLRFIQRMMQGLDPNDPAVQQLTNQVFNASQRAASNRGIGGPLAVSNTQQATAFALNDAADRRYSLGLQAQGLYDTGKVNDARLKMAQQQQAWDQARQAASDKYAQAAGVGQTLGSIYGGGLGALAGIAIPGAQPFIPALMAGGSQLFGGAGAQIGGSFSGYGNGSYNGMKPYRYPSDWGNS
jgi:hypothetical protein